MYGNIKAVLIAAVTILFASHAALAQEMSGSVYNKGEHRRIQYVKTGVIVGIRNVMIESEASTTARTTGAALGAAVFTAAGSRSNNPLAQFALATLGGVGGDMIARKVASSSRPGLEIVVKLDQGGYVAVVQEVDDQWPMAKGDLVRLIEGQETRVSPIR